MMRFWNYLRGSLQSIRVKAGEISQRNGPRHPPQSTSPQECPKPPHFLNSRDSSLSHERQPQDSGGDRAGQGSLGCDDEWRMLL